MEMKEILNLYQQDWALSPASYEVKIEKYKNSTILISGHTLAKNFAYTLLALNDKIKLNSNIILAVTDPNLEKSIPEEILNREDFTFTTIARTNTIKQKVDHIIHTGLCGVKIENTCENIKQELFAVKNILDLANSKNIKNALLLSPSQVYGKGENKYRAFSEMELGISQENSSTELLRTIESKFIALATSYQISWTILRSGVILGASSGLYNGLDHIFKGTNESKAVELYSTTEKISFIYLSDLFNGVIFAVEKNLTGIYNIAGENSSASTGMLSAMVHDINENAEINMTAQGEFQGCQLNCEKIKLAGYKATISLKTALELCLLSYWCKDENYRFPHEHQGRLEAIQQLLLGYLLEVDRICQKHNIKYYLGGGTLLGAARHKGFIPWDDDVDIMMDRENYDKFLAVAGKELPEGMILQDPKKDKNYFYCYAKLRLTNTVFSTDFSKHHKNTEDGFAFDIFCHDKTANSKLGQKLHSQLTLFWLAMVFNKWNNRPVNNSKKVQSAICNFLKNIFPLRFSMFMLLRTLEMFKHKRNAKYLYDGMGKSVHKGGFDKSFLEGELRVDFQGYKLPVPEKYKEYLTNHYGDFMDLPPISSRLLSHEITMCDLGKYSNFKISNGN